MLVAAAVCPHPPLLVPQVAQRAAAELDPLRQACSAAVGALLGQHPDLLVLVGAGTATRRHPAGTQGTLRRFGVAVDVVLGGVAPEEPREHQARAPSLPSLPLSLTIGAWLLTASAPADHGVPVLGQEVAADADVDACAALGRTLTAAATRVALLVLADGTARRGPQAPGYTDPRSVPLDDAVTTALAGADPAALLALNPVRCDEMLMAGRPALQVLAGAALGAPWRGELLAADDRYGVAYTVAAWSPSTAPAA